MRARLVRGVEAPKSFRIKTECRCCAFELDAFIRRNHSIFEHFGEKLLVIGLEFIDLDVPGQFARLERCRMLEDPFLAHRSLCLPPVVETGGARLAGGRDVVCEEYERMDMPCFIG
jgi:hypothetical protein